MASEMRNWTFSVECAISRPGEVVCISGSVPELGEWKASKVIQMDKVSDGTGNDDDSDNLSTWRVSLQIPLGVDIYFRYCVCVFVDRQIGETRNVIQRWETNLRARKIACHDECDHTVVHSLGFIASPTSILQTGWLTTETLVELKLYENALNIWKRKHLGKRFFVKVTAVDVKQAQNQSFSIDCDESLDHHDHREVNKAWPIVNVATLSDDDCEFKPQKQFGTEYTTQSFISFQAQIFDLQSAAFLVDIFAADPEVNSSSPDFHPEHIGSCYVLPQHLKSTEGRMQTHITSKKFQPIGQFSAVYLIIHPLKDFECDLAVSFAQYWNEDWKRLDVGHRGLGNSYSTTKYCSNIRENTIASLKDSISHGADMVEFDVQLSKDLVPVIYHEFEVCALVQKKKEDKEVSVIMPIKSLTLEQLQELKTHHVEELSTGLKTFEESEDHDAFPTLERALKVLDPNSGFNIEIKWDMEQKDGSRECHNPFEMNLFLDVVLKKVLECADRRKVVFSSFNPDVCTMLRCKQNKYPVLFLTSGVNSKYEPYRDPRSWTIHNASNFVKMSEILGINIMSEDILRDPSQIDLVKKRGQVLFSWTDDNNDKATVESLKQLDVDGIIYDRMDINNSKAVKKSVFRQETLIAESEIARSSSPTSSQCSCPKSDDERESVKGSGDEDEKKPEKEEEEAKMETNVFEEKSISAICT